MDEISKMIDELAAAFSKADYCLQINKPSGTDAEVELRSNMKSGTLMLWAVIAAIAPIYDAVLVELMSGNVVDVTGMTEMLVGMIKKRLELAAFSVISGEPNSRGWIKEE